LTKCVDVDYCSELKLTSRGLKVKLRLGCKFPSTLSMEGTITFEPFQWRAGSAQAWDSRQPFEMRLLSTAATNRISFAWSWWQSMISQQVVDKGPGLHRNSMEAGNRLLAYFEAHFQLIPVSFLLDTLRDGTDHTYKRRRVLGDGMHGQSQCTSPSSCHCTGP
jgi:hypothetical protein